MTSHAMSNLGTISLFGAKLAYNLYVFEIQPFVGGGGLGCRFLWLVACSWASVGTFREKGFLRFSQQRCSMAGTAAAPVRDCHGHATGAAPAWNRASGHGVQEAADAPDPKARSRSAAA